ncbi:hydrogenase formation protein HypD [Vibrio spartinae]|uniref:Hydrogenase maturation factor n=1 Tax=Vibrio spartinae TaxID=1918945 RepID=A0A1N6M0E2_9VIBR|nr:hydrogenase formation protein HypD [Vibrio spartinae]SIO92880.1 Hydrogenase expression/formation protein HypD [Vibrio spartinae]
MNDEITVIDSARTLYQGFRQPAVIRALAEQIRHKARDLPEPLYMMEVCGGHTHTIMKYGIQQLLPENLHFVHGPGCPVCIMPKERIDHAIILAQTEGVILVTLGDMIRVPGSRLSLAECRANGGSVMPIYDPMDVLEIAKQNPQQKVVYFAIGFETTTPMTAVLVQQARRLQLTNLCFHINHVLVPPAMNAVMADSLTRVNAFLGPSHVSVITGAKIYQPIVEHYHIPVVVAGFEPVDVLESVLMLVELALGGQPALQTQYTRAVSFEGNAVAQACIADIFDIRAAFNWRGLGNIPQSALKLRAQYADMDAEVLFASLLPQDPVPDHKACRCGDILRGLASPTDCKVFGKACQPSRPMGSCMVSSEGACNAYYRYAGFHTEPQE